jgi:hypothetical protein
MSTRFPGRNNAQKMLTRLQGSGSGGSPAASLPAYLLAVRPPTAGVKFLECRAPWRFQCRGTRKVERPLQNIRNPGFFETSNNVPMLTKLTIQEALIYLTRS